MPNKSKLKRMREMLTQPGVGVGVGAGDALCAKLIERAGFDFIWSSSLCVSASFAVPDANLISMSQYCEAARSMNEVVSIPIIADGDTGYGNANNVIYAVKKFEEAGIVGISIEDKKFPKDNSLLEGGRQELAPIEEFVGKIKAAKDHQRSEEFIIIARVEALIAGWGQAEAMKRSLRYVEAGADCILIHSKSKEPDEILEFIRNWNQLAPLVLVPTNYPSLTLKEVEKLKKVKLFIYANQPMRASVKAQEALLEEIKRAGGIHTIDSMMVPVSHIFDLQEVPAMKEDEKKYLV
ncbi:MAG TPA: isocitrate lyase/phosphoenolpyruvate mutase family protein [Thermodesulfobacteriota bacterium]|nr:isocitrate lyase/phosphoenolpyruvate mutase family protein [Thermodesulfobacteriota bacterium]